MARQGTEAAETILGFYEPIREELSRVGESVASVVSSAPREMREPLAHAIVGSGKRVRPAITILASRLRSTASESPIQMGAAIELLHLATLIHDDTVDNADVRRGRATLSSIWGPEVAILVGDYLFASSATSVCETGSIRVIRRFVAQTITELATGELDERMAAYDAAQTRQQYLERIYNKTASLFTTAAECGAVLSGAPEEEVQRLKAYGLNLGMAFQVVDDILDYEGSAQEVGKPVGADLAQGVLTLPALLLIERHPEGNPVVDLCRTRDADAHLERALDMVRGSGIIAEAYEVADEYRRNAVDALAGFPDSRYRRALLEIADYVVGRTK
jgi:geranylgeranyl pyrophosphate synthase